MTLDSQTNQLTIANTPTSNYRSTVIDLVVRQDLDPYFTWSVSKSFQFTLVEIDCSVRYGSDGTQLPDQLNKVIFPMNTQSAGPVTYNFVIDEAATPEECKTTGRYGIKLSGPDDENSLK